MAISVVLAEDSVLVREGMRAVLAAAPGIEVLRACADGAGLRRAIAETLPDVVVTDIRMPPGQSDEGVRIAQELRRDNPRVGVVVVSSANVPQYALDLLDGGSQGRPCLLKERLADMHPSVPASMLPAVPGHGTEASWSSTTMCAAGRRAPPRLIAGRRRVVQIGDSFENPVTRERFVWRATTASTGGEYCEFDLYLGAGAKLAAPHRHPASSRRSRWSADRWR